MADKQKGGKTFCIIGAGWCGVQIAGYLKKQGANVFVLDKLSGVGGTWSKDLSYVDLKTHLSAPCQEFMDYPYPTDITPTRNAIMTSKQVRTYMQRYIKDKNIEVHYNKDVKSVNCLPNGIVIKAFDSQTNEVVTYQADYVYVTGAGSKAVALPKYEGYEKFKGSIYKFNKIQPIDLERISNSGESVLVVGGNKGAMDMVNLCADYNIPFHWMARKAYYMLPYDKLFNVETRSKLKCYLTLGGTLLHSYLPKLGMKAMKKLNCFEAAHDNDDPFAFHFGIVNDKDMKVAKAAHFTQGEIAAYYEDGVITKTGKKVACDNIFGAIGCMPNEELPTFLVNDVKIDICKTQHFYQFMIQPQLPNVFFCGPIVQKGYGMLNGHNIATSSLIHIAENITLEELQKRTKQEEKVLTKHFKNLKPHMLRSMSDTKHFTKYLRIVDSICRRNRCAKPLNLSVVQFLYNGMIHGAMNTPTYREPSKKELKKALQTTEKLATQNTLNTKKEIHNPAY